MRESPPALPKDIASVEFHPPLLEFIETCRRKFVIDESGALASYIPELSKADPAHFGISLVTIDGHAYEVGETRVPFTIQSISKAFVFGLALDLAGAERVEATIGVEPSGEAFNSIRLNASNRPFNAMVNTGAIACSGLIHAVRGADAFETIREALGRFAGRELAVDDSVFISERATGDRNRAIGYLLKNSSVIANDVEAALDVYFRQCSILVNARDIAVMAATLANRGLNPVTGDQVISPYAVARTLSVMTSSGMYDYAGEWIYRVGMPAKSGVGGGIIASLPSNFGLGTFSPLLDSHGNSVRGIKVCEAMSDHFDLHMLDRTGHARTGIVADYDLSKNSSRRSRRPDELAILVEHSNQVRIIELFGALSFLAVDYASRELNTDKKPQFMIFDFRRVAGATSGAARLLTGSFRNLEMAGVTVILSGIDAGSPTAIALGKWIGDAPYIRSFHLLDEAIEWAEDQIVYRHGGADDPQKISELGEQALLLGLSADEIAAVTKLGTQRTYQAGDCVISAKDKASSLFFLQSGLVSVKLSSGVRLATLTSGMVFGEMALLDERRTADVIADTTIVCHVIPLEIFEKFRSENARVGEQIMRNLAMLLVARLVKANKKVDLLTAE